MRTINFENRIETCQSALVNLAISHVKIALELRKLQHESAKAEEIKNLEDVSAQLNLIEELLTTELERLQGVFKYSQN